MIRSVQLVISCTSLAALSACIGLDPTSLTQLESKGDAFQTALHAEYAELAIKESTRYDFRNATRFARKAQAAAAGEDVEPERPERWGIEAFALSELSSAREQMVTMLRTTPARAQAPSQAAAAQAAYDCWLEELEEGHQPDDIEACRQRFAESLAELETAGAPRVVPAAGPSSEAPVERQYEVFFSINSTTLSPDGHAVVRELVESALESGASKITVAGHADRSGPRAYNERLSRQRAEAVAEELIRLGIPAERVRSAGFGENQPAVATSDGMAHQMNRRVVITLI